MAGITINHIGAKLNTVLDEVRSMRSELSAIRAEIASFQVAQHADESGRNLASDGAPNRAETPCEVR